MSKFVRSSKFRHVYGSPFKRQDCYDNIRVTRNSWDSNYCDVNNKFLAVITESSGGGAFIVLPLEKQGKLKTDTPIVTGHTSAVLDVAWNPFNDNELASCAEDATIRIWTIPDGGLTENLKEADVVLNGHTRKVGQIVWHPTVRGLLFSVSNDTTVRAWNSSTGEQLKQYEGFGDVVYCLSFNYKGNRFAVVSKDKKLRVFDVHSEKMLKEVLAHKGSKASRCVYLSAANEEELVVTTGFSESSERQCTLWSEDLEVKESLRIDTSSGLLFPFYDPYLKILYLAGKGDGNIRYYEVTRNAPYIHYLSEFKSDKPQRGFGFLPKRACRTEACEIARFYKLHSTNFVEPIQMVVPRKSELFQDDLYPECAGDEPSLEIEDFLAGKDAAPKLVSLKEGFSSQKGVVQASPSLNTNKKNELKDFADDVEQLKEQLKSARLELKKKDAEIAKLRAELGDNKGM
ncbi:coronin-1C-like [Zophobas morio]|uniref:coronin-1C-like n=1 Tax=Zophobas morio TaxID=2755281 RepID=UPI003083D63B